MRGIVCILLLIFFTGCCKVYCDGTELAVSFRKFKAVDTDTVLFVSYQPGSGQTKPVDTARFLYQISSTDTTRSSFSHSISSSYDWKIQLPSLNRQFVIENFALSREKCRCGGSYKAIKSFAVNGAQKEGLFIELE